MPTIVDCPSCNRKLRVPDDLLGKKVKCPTCSGTFDAITTPAPVPTPAPSASGPSPSGPSASGPSGSVMPQLSLEEEKSPPAAVSDYPPPAPPASSGTPAPPVPSSEQETLSQVAPRSEPESELAPCPYCGEKNPVEATRCSYCREHLDDEDQSDRPWDRGYRPYRDVRRDSEPHRGTLILVLGIVSIVLSSLSACSYGVLGIFGLIMGICVWVMGQKDLKKMKSNVMDPQGMGSTQAGWICGIIGTAFGAIGFLILLCVIGFVIFMTASVPKMAPPPPRPPTTRPAAPPAQRKQGMLQEGQHLLGPPQTTCVV